mgnify:CR=1 FL=1
MKYSTVFIVPYFGSLPHQMPLFLKSCAYNSDFTWMIFTDDKSYEQFDVPKNVMFIDFSFNQFNDLLKSKFGNDVTIQSPYKLCDLKPMYGYIFEDYISKYDYWGHTDLDIVFGRIADFISDDILEKYDKLFCLGHFIIYRNTFDNNRVFMSSHKGAYIYKQVLDNPNICWFDEEWKDDNNINRIFLENGKDVLQDDFSLNFSDKHNSFKRVVYCGHDDPRSDEQGYYLEDNENTRYFWSDGILFSITVANGVMQKREYMYMHYMHRNMKIPANVASVKNLLIVPNSFIPLNHIPESLFELNAIHYNKLNFDMTIRKYKLWFKDFPNKVSRKIRHLLGR